MFESKLAGEFFRLVRRLEGRALAAGRDKPFRIAGVKPVVGRLESPLKMDTRDCTFWATAAGMAEVGVKLVGKMVLRSEVKAGIPRSWPGINPRRPAGDFVRVVRRPAGKAPVTRAGRLAMLAGVRTPVGRPGTEGTVLVKPPTRFLRFWVTVAGTAEAVVSVDGMTAGTKFKKALFPSRLVGISASSVAGMFFKRFTTALGRELTIGSTFRMPAFRGRVGRPPAGTPLKPATRDWILEARSVGEPPAARIGWEG
jgi:hypothetical protein